MLSVVGIIRAEDEKPDYNLEWPQSRIQVSYPLSLLPTYFVTSRNIGQVQLGTRLSKSLPALASLASKHNNEVSFVTSVEVTTQHHLNVDGYIQLVQWLAALK